ncbi:MAG: trehalose-phosphatase [Proteobacteria bacterium]|nr:trehalose-phosphatase [Pseudomonadota bacterium]
MQSSQSRGAGVDPARTCLFLDVDGTLLDLVKAPEQVRVPAALVSDLGQLTQRLGGALALVSGRSVAQLDELFQPLRLPASGVHGLELRLAGQPLRRRVCTPDALHRIRSEAERLIVGQHGLQLEFKPSAVALHYRGRPEAEDELRARMRALAARHAEQFSLIDGDKVLELVPQGCSKAAAIDELMAVDPFRGRRPCYLGDDTTDFGAFEAVRRYEGVDVAVGNRVTARWHLSGPAAVRQWLAQLAAGESRLP